MSTFGPLPAELRRKRSRKTSRPSPYPQARFMPNPVAPPVFVPPSKTTSEKPQPLTSILKDKSVNMFVGPQPLNALKASVTPVFSVPKESPKKLVPKPSTLAAKPGVPSAGRKPGLAPKSSNLPVKVFAAKKENAIGQGSTAYVPSFCYLSISLIIRTVLASPCASTAHVPEPKVVLLLPRTDLSVFKGRCFAVTP